MRSRQWSWLVIVLVVGGCRDAAAPLTEQPAAPQLSLLGLVEGQPTPSGTINILRQASGAPALQSRSVSFWARTDKGSVATIDYQDGQPFLRFEIQKNGLVAGAAGVPLERRDSVLVSLTVDPVNFKVDFQPSGVLFAARSPAVLTMWYQYADPDLNSDGVVNFADVAAARALAFFWNDASGKMSRWFRLASSADPVNPFVLTALYHFSEYAVSW